MGHLLDIFPEMCYYCAKRRPGTDCSIGRLVYNRRAGLGTLHTRPGVSGSWCAGQGSEESTIQSLGLDAYPHSGQSISLVVETDLAL
jgi:hypothetical protein